MPTSEAYTIITRMNTTHRDRHRLLNTGSSREDFFGGVLLGAQSLGFEHCVYAIRINRPGKGWQFAMIGSLPSAWQERYWSRDYQAIDPTIRHSMHSSLPLVWSTELFAENRGLLRATQAIGFNYGWTYPMPESNGEFGMLTFARAQGVLAASELQGKLPLMRWYAHVAHSTLFHSLGTRCRQESFAGLTSREVELLRLTAEGKTAADISEMLGIADRTANFHISNAMEKLGASNKTHAVVCALKLGLLD